MIYLHESMNDIYSCFCFTYAFAIKRQEILEIAMNLSEFFVWNILYDHMCASACVRFRQFKKMILLWIKQKKSKKSK